MLSQVLFKVHLCLLPDGIRIASSNTIEALMEDDFKLFVNDNVYIVNTPRQERLTKVRIVSSFLLMIVFI